MSTFLALCLLMLLSGSARAQTSEEFVTLPKGTAIDLKMAQTLTSKHAYVGERVELLVAEDVFVGAALVVPQNTRVLGTVRVGKAKEGGRDNPHKVVLQVDYIRLGERRIALSGMHSDKGKVDKGTAVASTIFFGLTGLLIALESGTGVIKEGTTVQASVAEDVLLPVLPSPALVAPTEQPAPTPPS